MLTDKEIDFATKLGIASDSSRWKEVVIKSLLHTLTKQDIFDYYSHPKIRAAMLSQLKGKPAIIHQSFDPDAPVVLKRWEGGQPIKLEHDSGEVNNPKDYQYWIERRAVEFHPVLGNKTNVAWVDIDPKEGHPWENTKSITADVGEALSNHPDIGEVSYRFSGGRGFHVIAELNKEVHPDIARELVNSVIAPLADKSKGIVLGVPRTGQLRLDTSTLKDTGSLRGIYSLNKSTGLVCVPVEEENLMAFKPEYASIASVIGGRPKRATPFRT
jgi:DNA primase